MKRKLSALFCCLLCLLLCFGALTASAESPDAARAQAIADGILTFMQEGKDTQAWIDSTLSAQAGVGAE
jgi:hypothetical protein